MQRWACLIDLKIERGVKVINRQIRQGDIYYVDLGNNKGSIQSGYRPIIIYQNDIGNKYSPTVNGYCITKASNNKPNLPTHVRIGREAGLKEESIILVEQPVTVNKTDLQTYVGRCTEDTLKEIWKASAIQHGKIKPRFNVKYIEGLIRQIKYIDDFINRYRDRYDIAEELFERSCLLAEIIYYCKEYNIDYKNILISNSIIKPNYTNKIAI